MARTVVVYVVADRPDGSFAVVRTGGDLPERVVFAFRTRAYADRLAGELNQAYMSGWHDCLIEEAAISRGEIGGGKPAQRKKQH